MRLHKDDNDNRLAELQYLWRHRWILVETLLPAGPMHPRRVLATSANPPVLLASNRQRAERRGQDDAFDAGIARCPQDSQIAFDGWLVPFINVLADSPAAAFATKSSMTRYARFTSKAWRWVTQTGVPRKVPSYRGRITPDPKRTACRRLPRSLRKPEKSVAVTVAAALTSIPTT